MVVCLLFWLHATETCVTSSQANKKGNLLEGLWGTSQIKGRLEPLRPGMKWGSPLMAQQQFWILSSVGSHEHNPAPEISSLCMLTQMSSSWDAECLQPTVGHASFHVAETWFLVMTGWVHHRRGCSGSHPRSAYSALWNSITPARLNLG